MMKKHPRRTRQPAKRTGGAVVELVVCLPVIVLLVFASIEACSMIFVRQAMSASAYEGIRVAVTKDASTTAAEERCTEVLTGRQVHSANITFEPADVNAAAPGQPITLTITAPCDANSVMPPWFFGGRTMEVRATMVKE